MENCRPNLMSAASSERLNGGSEPRTLFIRRMSPPPKKLTLAVIALLPSAAVQYLKMQEP
eukprot:412717-Amphidinium_carterae.2